MATTRDLKLTPINDWQEELSLNGKKTLIQRGDIILDAGPVDGFVGIFTLMIRLVTESPYHHAMFYDHDWRVVHATWPHVQSNYLQCLYLQKPDLILSWVRPKFHKKEDGAVKTWPVTAADAAKALKFAEKQIGDHYDLIANAGFLFRADGLPGMPHELQELFQNRNWLASHDEWYCSELASAAWWFGAKLALVDDMQSKDFLSPADIYDSLYLDLVCTLIVENGEAVLYTK